MSTSDATPSSSALDGSSSPSPPPSEMQQLKTALYSKTSKAALEHSLGLGRLDGVSELANHMIVVCFDTESWKQDHNKLTEIGVATFDSRDMRTLKHPSIHGEHLLEQVYFYHARFEENAHLINTKYCPGTLMPIDLVRLPASLKVSNPEDNYIRSRSLQDVVDNIEAASQHQDWDWGTRPYCSRCSSRNHLHNNTRDYRCTAKVKCLHGAASTWENRKRAAESHATQQCISFALGRP
jgi:hypothetical protein